MKYLKYSGICAAGFFTEYFMSAVIAAFLVFPPLYVFGVLPCCILAGKIHCFYTSHISNFLRAAGGILHYSAWTPHIAWSGGRVYKRGNS